MRIAQTPLLYNTYSVNGSSTIDPSTGIYYYVSSLPQGGVGVIGVSISTGLLVSVHPVSSVTGAQTYFDMIRHPSDCYNAEIVRPSSIDGGAGLHPMFVSNTKVYPNPFDDHLQIDSQELIEAYTLRDAQGKIILDIQALSHKILLSLGQIPSGVYFLNIQTNQGFETIKLVK